MSLPPPTFPKIFHKYAAVVVYNIHCYNIAAVDFSSDGETFSVLHVDTSLHHWRSII